MFLLGQWDLSQGKTWDSSPGVALEARRIK